MWSRVSFPPLHIWVCLSTAASSQVFFCTVVMSFERRVFKPTNQNSRLWGLLKAQWWSGQSVQQPKWNWATNSVALFLCLLIVILSLLPSRKFNSLFLCSIFNVSASLYIPMAMCVWTSPIIEPFRSILFKPCCQLWTRVTRLVLTGFFCFFLLLPWRQKALIGPGRVRGQHSCFRDHNNHGSVNHGHRKEKRWEEDCEESINMIIEM